MAAMASPISIRLRAASPGLLALPWLDPLQKWPEDAASFRDLNVGPSRHLVRFVEADYVLYALKELPSRVAEREYRVLRDLQIRELPAVHPVGLVDQPDTGNSILVTEYLEHSWQFRRLFRRLPRELVKHRERLLDAIAGLLVDLHRAGVFWGDCSLANTLFKRDGQLLQAFLVDAETSEIHPALTDGQRAHDLDILVENVAGDLVDVSMELGESGEHIDEDLAAAESIAERYRALWDELTHEETFANDERYKVEARVRRLNELGFDVDELDLDGYHLLHATRADLLVRLGRVDDAVAATGMEYGGITPIGLPGDWRVLIDARVAAAPRVVVGSGVRRSKLTLPGSLLGQLPGATVIEGLAQLAR